MKRYLVLIALMLFPLLLTEICRAETEPRPSDSIANALLFGDIDAPPAVNLTPPPEWQPGMRRTFSVLDIASGTLQKCEARIFLVMDNMVFWCEESAWNEIPADLPQRLIDFDTVILPWLRDLFGHEKDNAPDHDPRFHVLFTERIGLSYNGYFSAGDSADPRIQPTSNGIDLLFINTSLFRQNSDSVTDTLAHEFQHMIHFSYDTNEMSFINEGFSGLSEYTALGYIRDTFIRHYLNDTGRSLVFWPESGSSQPYYGSSFLFSMYLYDRFGKDLIRETVRRPENGMRGISQALRVSGIPYRADDVFLQWGAALLGQLTQAPVRDGDYRNYRFPQDGITRDIQQLGCGIPEEHEVSQYGLRFYQTACGIPCRVIVSGAAESRKTGLIVPGGRTAWWSGAVNNSLALLSREFDLSRISGPADFEYDISYSIENGYDYYYLLLEDEAGRITRLSPSTSTDADPAGQNMGKGTTGDSNEIIHEKIGLSSWCGQKIRLTFVYLTDTAGTSDGMLLDNFRIRAIGFQDGAEDSDNGWEAEGFSRTVNSVPQHYALILLRPQPDRTSIAELYTFAGGEPFAADCPEGNCAFGITAIEPDVRSRAVFSVRTDPVMLP